MSKLNAATKNSSAKTQNMDGNDAYIMTPKTELLTRVATCFWNEPKFYGEKNEESEKIVDLAKRVSEKDVAYVFKLAAYCRNVLNLRTVSVVLFDIAANAKSEKSTGLARKYAPHVIKRADEITEALAYQFATYGGKKAMPNGMRRALGRCFASFDAYAFGKYSRDGKVKLRDALRILHPKPSDKARSKLYKSILDGTLESPDTWEVMISSKGSTTENWDAAAKVMPYFATLRNARNCLDHGCNMKPILERLEDKNLVHKSRLLPFRFWAAYNSIRGNSNPFTGATMGAIGKAMDYSLDNVPDLSGVTAVIIDHSGSMDDKLSEKSDLKRKDAADVLAAIIRSKSRLNVVVEFANDARFMNLADHGVAANVEAIQRNSLSGGTCTEKAFELLTGPRGVKHIDRIILLTDEQDNVGTAQAGWTLARKAYPGVKLYLVDLAGYGTSQIAPQNGVVKLAGFSEKILNFISLSETGFDAMAKAVEKWEPKKAETEDD